LVAEAVSTKCSVEPPMYAVIEIGHGNIRVNLDAFLDRYPTVR